MPEPSVGIAPADFNPIEFQMWMDALEHFFVQQRICGYRVGFTITAPGVVYVTVSIPKTHFVSDVEQIILYAKDRIPLLFLKELEFTPEEALKL